MAGSVLFAQLGFYLTTAALPLYLRHLGAPSARIGLDIGAGSFAALALTVLAGPVLNRAGPRAFLVTGSSLYVLAALVMLAFPAEGAITAGRLLQGGGLALIGPGAYAAVPILAPDRTGSAMGIMATIASAPLAIGPAVGLALYQHGGAIWMLVPTMTLGLVGLAIGLSLRVPAPPGQAGTPIRFGYSVSWTLPLTANVLNAVYFGGIVAYLPLFMARVHGPNAGIFFTADAVGVVLLRIPSGMLADRTKPAVPMLLGLGITILGLAAFIPAAGVIWLILAGAGTGIGAGLFANGLLTDLVRLTTVRNRGTAMSLAVATGSLGAFAGGSASGLLYDPAGFGGVILLGAVVEAIGLVLVAPSVRGGTDGWQPGGAGGS